MNTDPMLTNPKLLVQAAGELLKLEMSEATNLQQAPTVSIVPRVQVLVVLTLETADLKEAMTMAVKPPVPPE